jgi:hypothetical protein
VRLHVPDQPAQNGAGDRQNNGNTAQADKEGGWIGAVVSEQLPDGEQG